MITRSKNQIEDSILRSVLIFNTLPKNKGRKELMQKTILSIITYGNGRFSLKEVHTFLRDRFRSDITIADIESKVKELQDKKLVILRSDGKLVSNVTSEEAIEIINKIALETDRLIDGIINRVDSGHTLSRQEEISIRKNAREALSGYFQRYGYSYFGLKNKPYDDTINAVAIASRGLNEKLGKLLIGALAELINSPTNEESVTLETWARAYVAFEAINLDPQLRNFKSTKIRDKSFVIDTDVALHALTKNARYSQVYRIIANSLRHIGCNVYIPRVIINEIQDHIDAALKWQRSYGSKWLEMTDDILERTNVFVEDYVKTIRSDEDKTPQNYPFSIYIDNIYDKEYSGLLLDNLKEVFGENLKVIETLDSIDGEIQHHLLEMIQRATENSAKGAKRDDDKNREIAETDVSLYLTINRMNCTIANKDENTLPFNEKVYLLTKQQKTVRSAKELGIYNRNIICDPSGLLSILQEMGTIDDDVKLVNLFENPFLVHAADIIWEDIKPLLDSGIIIKNKDIHRLRYDVDSGIDKILTCQTYEERLSAATELTEHGYSFAEDLANANETIIKQGVTISDLSKQIRELQARNETLSKERKKNLYIKRSHKK